MRTNLLSLMAIIVVLLVSSCQKDTLNSKNQNDFTNSGANSRTAPLELSINDFKSLYAGGKNSDVTTTVRSANPSSFSSLNNSKDLYGELMNEIVEDDVLKKLLNQDGEIIVDNNIYKITPYGTFFTGKDNRDSLIGLLNSIKSQYPIEREEDLYKPMDLSSYVVSSDKKKYGILFNEE